MNPKTHNHPFFLSELRRNAYLDKLIAEGCQVKAATAFIEAIPFRFIADHPAPEDNEEFYGMLFTVEDSP